MGTLRLLLALSVLASHVGAIYGLNMVGGAIAVQAFFIISGFYMSLILNEKYVGVNNSFKLFISNRFLRLYPIYGVVLVATILTCVLIKYTNESNGIPIIQNYTEIKPNLSAMLYLIFTNVCIYGQDVVMFLGIDTVTGHLFFTDNFWNTSPPLYSFLFVPQGWSLALELTFYFIAPYVVRRSIPTIILLILGTLLLRYYIYSCLGLTNDPWTYRFFPTEMLFFLLGSISYHIYLFLKPRYIPRRTSMMMLFLVLNFTLLFPLLPTSSNVFAHFCAKDLMYFLIIVVAIPILFIYFKNDTLDNLIGELSYPVYIVHLLVARIVGVLELSIFNNGLGIAIITIIAAYFLNKFITYPIERIRQQRLNSS